MCMTKRTKKQLTEFISNLISSKNNSIFRRDIGLTYMASAAAMASALKSDMSSNSDAGTSSSNDDSAVDTFA